MPAHPVAPPGPPPSPPPAGPEKRLNARAAELLAARIADGSLPPGTRLLESRLAALLGTSRGPARLALARLAQQGLLRRAEGPGYLVAGTAPTNAGGAASEAPLAGLDGQRLTAAASWERLYGEVERAIVARTAFAGWRVVEAELARAHGVSRTVAREVVARLHQRGLLRRDERAHWLAPALTEAHVGEQYEVRALLEPAALLRAAPHLPRGFLAALRARLEQAAGLGERLEGATLDALEADLHERLLDHCRNRALVEAVRRQQSLLVVHSFLYRWAPRLFPVEPFLPEHLRVVERLEAGAPEAAAEALRAHLLGSLDRAVARIRQVQRAPQPPALPWLQMLPAEGG